MVKIVLKDIAELESDIRKRFRALNSSRTQDLRTLRREFSKQLSRFDGKDVIQLALNLLNTRVVPRFVAYELVQHHKDAMQSVNSRNIKLLGEGIDSWDTVDTFASYLSGPAWREHQIPDSLIEKWAGAKDRWWRRAAVVSTVPLNNKARGGSGDAERTLQICRLVINDRDDMVVKALSWALRELAKRDAKSVEQFVVEYKDKLASRVLREVDNKLTTGLKNPKARGR
ncbi:MAG TPA: DNA alkylation repair protein [Pyrinomonadaceae bacterium]